MHSPLETLTTATSTHPFTLTYSLSKKKNDNSSKPSPSVLIKPTLTQNTTKEPLLKPYPTPFMIQQLTKLQSSILWPLNWSRLLAIPSDSAIISIISNNLSKLSKQMQLKPNKPSRTFSETTTRTSTDKLIYSTSPLYPLTLSSSYTINKNKEETSINTSIFRLHLHSTFLLFLCLLAYLEARTLWTAQQLIDSITDANRDKWREIKSM